MFDGQVVNLTGLSTVHPAVNTPTIVSQREATGSIPEKGPPSTLFFSFFG